MDKMVNYIIMILKREILFNNIIYQLKVFKIYVLNSNQQKPMILKHLRQLVQILYLKLTQELNNLQLTQKAIKLILNLIIFVLMEKETLLFLLKMDKLDFMIKQVEMLIVNIQLLVILSYIWIQLKMENGYLLHLKIIFF